MSTFTYYIPTQIKIKGNFYFLKKQLMFVGNSQAAKQETIKIRKENPNKIIRLFHCTICEYI